MFMQSPEPAVRGRAKKQTSGFFWDPALSGLLFSLKDPCSAELFIIIIGIVCAGWMALIV